jgi:hypothetical protein
MPVIKKSPGYQIDGRVSIALDALDDNQKRVVESALIDRAHFVSRIADTSKVRRITTDDPLYALSIPSGLRIIYSQVGDDIVVMDLMRKATLDWYWQGETTKGKRNGAKNAKPAPKVRKPR